MIKMIKMGKLLNLFKNLYKIMTKIYKSQKIYKYLLIYKIVIMIKNAQIHIALYFTKYFIIRMRKCKIF